MQALLPKKMIIILSHLPNHDINKIMMNEHIDLKFEAMVGTPHLHRKRQIKSMDIESESAILER